MTRPRSSLLQPGLSLKLIRFTLADVSGTTLSVRQISDTGVELDRFVVTK